MEKRSSVFARLLAALALAAAVVAVVVIVSAATSDDTNPGHRQHPSGTSKQHEEGEEGEGGKKQTEAATYTVQSGDTLISIAHKTGVPLAELLALNPEVDPQILIAGQTLKLK
jgi:LysM repeat protein